jgi:ATP-dependent RNA helicase DeaD
MTTQFSDFNLLPELEQAVQALGYSEPMPVQTAVIPLMIAGQDVIGQAQTGTGKTAAFALPILHNLDQKTSGVQALVLTPTRELALQVAQAFEDLGRELGARVIAVYGGAAYRPQIQALRPGARSGAQVVVGTPGRLLDLMQKEILDISTLHTVVLDEADEMLSMGFIEDIETILAATPAARQTALFSATMPQEIRRLAESYMREPQTVMIRGEKITAELIEQRLYWVNNQDKAAALTRLFEVEDITSALIFVRTRQATGELANELNARGFPAEVLNGDLTQEAREQTMSRFRQNKIKVLVATDVAARGLDIEDISHVFNVELPPDPELYVHRIGRTGRAGKAGIAISLVSPQERRYLRQIEAFTRQKLTARELPTEAEILAQREESLSKQMVVWLQRSRYKREREIVAALAEQGYDPLEIAAAAIKIARADEKQRPIAPVSPVVVETRGERGARPWKPRREGENSRQSNRQGGSQPSEVSHETGMVRLSLNMGRKDGLRPNDVVGAIAAHARIPGSKIGKIYIQDGNALVDVPRELVEQVLVNPKPMHIRKQRVQLEVA